MRWRGTLSQRLSVVFAVLLLACCGASMWLQMRANVRFEQEVTQRLSLDLARHIASNTALMQRDGLNEVAVRELFGKLMDVNPSVEVYLLAPDGRIVGQAAPDGHLKLDRVDLAPVRRLLDGAMLPVLGDDPRGEGARKVFSAAPLKVDSHDAGYVYVVLSGEERDALVARVTASKALQTAVWSVSLVALLGLIAGLVAFASITRPLRELTRDVRGFENEGAAAFDGPGQRANDRALLAVRPEEGDEIATLRLAFAQMTQRIAEQWRELVSRDQQRRELFANISHDLRTPLTSLHGYLETLLVKADSLDAADNRRYLEIALGQSRKVGRLAQELFELARLEYGVVKPEKESFAIADLVQDVFQKFELAAEARRQRLVADIAPGLPVVHADLALIERVLTNLLDNAIRHTPDGGEIAVRLQQANGAVEVQVSDTGPGIPKELRESIFTRPVFSSMADRSGGLGLVIVKRILQLHDTDIRLVTPPDRGATFTFQLQ